MITLIAFLVAIFILVVVHEYGHYKMALLCGVKVERFSLGFGPVLFRWRPKGSETEYVLSALPLGGYVKMADEREGEVAAQDLPRAFNRQPLKKKAAIVAAGPLCNLILAVCLYTVVGWMGQSELEAVIATPTQNSMAAEAGFASQDKILGYVQEPISESQELNEDQYQKIRSFSDLSWLITQAGMNKNDLYLVVQRGQSTNPMVLRLPISEVKSKEVGRGFLSEIGFVGPHSEPIIDSLAPNGSAQAAGLQIGDKILKVGDLVIQDTVQLIKWVRRQNTAETEKTVLLWTISRNNSIEEIAVPIKVETVDGQAVGRIGATFEPNAATVLVRAGFFEGISNAFSRTYEMSVLMLKTIGRMIIGEASLKNLSGPISIAEYAGKTASYGLTSYIVFLGVVSVSLGVLNLLPLPVLDGGHLMYYLWEGITKKPISEQVNAWLQKFGLVIVLLMMVIGVFNDVMRHL